MKKFLHHALTSAVRVLSVLAIILCIAFFAIPTIANSSISAADSDINVSLFVKLQKFLVCDGSLSSDDAILCDFDQSGTINSLDFCILKQKLIVQSSETQTSTTTSSTTTSTTTSSTTTTTTTTSEPIVTTSFSAPDMFDLIEQYQQGMSEDEYNGMLATVDLFGLEYYKIVYSEELIPYSLILTSDSFAVDQDICDFFLFQACSVEDSKILIPNNDYTSYGYDLVIWRPLSEYDEGLTLGVRENMRAFGGTESQIFSGINGHYWCIIPCTLDEETGELVENLTLLYPISE